VAFVALKGSAKNVAGSLSLRDESEFGMNMKSARWRLCSSLEALESLCPGGPFHHAYHKYRSAGTIGRDTVARSHLVAPTCLLWYGCRNGDPCLVLEDPPGVVVVLVLASWPIPKATLCSHSMPREDTLSGPFDASPAPKPPPPSRRADVLDRKALWSMSPVTSFISGWLRL